MRRSCPHRIFSTFTTLPHNLIKEKATRFDRVDLQKRIKELWFTLFGLYRKKGFFSLPLTKVDIYFGRTRICATSYHISWIIIILDLKPSYTDKLLEVRWVPIAPCQRKNVIKVVKHVKNSKTSSGNLKMVRRFANRFN